MANKTWKDMGIKLDGSTGTIVDISAFVNSQSLQSAITILESTGMGATSRTKQNGLPNISIPLNGFLNGTTEAIFGKIISGTSATKTFSFQAFTGRHFTGECVPSNIQFSGTPDDLETFSTTLEVTGAVTRTSVAAA